jgi:cyanate permease
MARMVLAHQGGWDEALFVLAPLAVIGLLLWFANRRADAQQRTEAERQRNAAD